MDAGRLGYMSEGMGYTWPLFKPAQSAAKSARHDKRMAVFAALRRLALEHLWSNGRAKGREGLGCDRALVPLAMRFNSGLPTADVGHYVSATCRRNDLVERVALFCVLEHQNGR